MSNRIPTHILNVIIANAPFGYSNVPYLCDAIADAINHSRDFDLAASLISILEIEAPAIASSYQKSLPA